MSPDGSYNGYANYQTWNVCLWLSNDEMLHTLAKHCESYDHFKILIREVLDKSLLRFETPEGVAWSDSGVNLAEMKEYWEENFSKVPA